MIKTREQYVEFQSKMIRVIDNRLDPTQIWQTIEALLEVARGANAIIYGDPLEMGKVNLRDVLAKLPDWMTEEE